MKHVWIVAALAGGLAFAAPAAADNDFGLGVKVGTLGIGVEASWAPLPYLDLRVGMNRYSLDDSGTESGIAYDAEIDLDTAFATLNLHIPVTPLRVTAGWFSNGNQIALVSQESATYEIGDQTFAAADVGTLRGDVEFKSSAPYAGLGLDFTFLDRLMLSFDAGVLFQDTPEVALSADGPIANEPLFLAELEKEQAALQDELDDYELYPVVSVGFAWKF
jgi:hypothetical protein